MTAPSRSPSYNSTAATQSSAQAIHNARAALVGATTAFHRDASRPRLTPQTSEQMLQQPRGAENVGRVGVENLRRAPSTASSTGGSLLDASARSQWRGHTTSTPDLTEQRPQVSRSHSHQAAVLASARSAPTASPITASKTNNAAKSQIKPAVAPKPRRLSVSLSSKSQPDAISTDPTSIAPTTSLVNLFEQKTQASTSRPSTARPASIVSTSKREVPTNGLKSAKVVGGITSLLELEVHDGRGRQAGTSTGDRREDQIKKSNGESDAARPPPTVSVKPPSQASTPNLDRGGSARPGRPADRLSPASARTMRAPPAPSSRAASTIPPERRPSTDASVASGMPARPSTSSAYSYASTNQTTSNQSITAQYRQAYPKRSTPLTTGDDLANALVASSLASTRAPSPRRVPPPPVPVPRRRHRHKFGFSRTPSPIKSHSTGGGMLHTLRATTSSDSLDDSDSSRDAGHPYAKHQKRRLVRKHPNKHHEGDRKRWRDALTAEERKRYEGVWAANRGILCALRPVELRYLERSPRDDPAASKLREGLKDQVEGVVVRELWSRSRLSSVVLEAVWDLVVDSFRAIEKSPAIDGDGGDARLVDGSGRLTKEEFVVGLWLIDQRLKGRKLPVRVSESVWDSVRGLPGVKVKRKI